MSYESEQLKKKLNKIMALADEASKLVIEENNEYAYSDLMWAIDSAIRILLSHLEYGRELQKSYSQDGLTINQVEAEGYVRGCLSILDEIEQESDILAKFIKKAKDSN